jgi:hypothetical protein
MPTLTDLLRRDLLAARRGGDRAAAATLRATLAALANAEAVPVDDAAPRGASEHVAGLGAGPTEAERRLLPEAEQVTLVRAEIAELHEAAAAYERVDGSRAEDARAGAAVLERVLAHHAG